MKGLLAVARISMREWGKTPAFFLVHGGILLLLLLLPKIVFFGFGEEPQMIREMAVSSLLLAAVVSTYLLGSTIGAGDRRRRAEEMLLSRSITREEFLAGKILGAIGALTLAFLVEMVAVAWLEWKCSTNLTPGDFSRILSAVLVQIWLIAILGLLLANIFSPAMAGAGLFAILFLGHMWPFLIDKLSNYSPWFGTVLGLFPDIGLYNTAFLGFQSHPSLVASWLWLLGYGLGSCLWWVLLGIFLAGRKEVL